MAPVRRLFPFLFMLAALAAGPGPARALDLTIWTTEFERDRIETIRYLVNAFAVDHRGLKIELTGINENEFVERFEAAAKLGAAPDIVDASGTILNALSRSGFLDWDAAGAAIDGIGHDRFFKGTLDALAAPETGRYLAIPFRQWVQGVWYRADWFAAAAVPPPTTWQRLREAARRFHAPDEGRYGIVIGNMADVYAEQIFTQLALSNGARLFGKDGAFAPDIRRFAETFAFYKELAGYAPPGEVTWRQRDLFLENQAAMMFYSTFIADDIALHRIDEPPAAFQTSADRPSREYTPAGDLVNAVKMVPLIEHDTAAGYGEISGIGLVTADDGEKRAMAQQLVKFLYRDDIYISWLHMAPGGMLPALRDAGNNPQFFRDLQGIYRRYGRARILGFMAGLDGIEPFGLYTNGDATTVRALTRSKFLAALVRDVSVGQLSPMDAARKLADGPAAAAN
jgi:multiple sugar transport system substrate-binding protein